MQYLKLINSELYQVLKLFWRHSVILVLVRERINLTVLILWNNKNTLQQTLKTRKNKTTEFVSKFNFQLEIQSYEEAIWFCLFLCIWTVHPTFLLIWLNSCGVGCKQYASWCCVLDSNNPQLLHCRRIYNIEVHKFNNLHFIDTK